MEATPFQKFKEGVIDILKVTPENTSVILQKIKSMYPEEFDDAVRCIHRNVDYGRPEWEHIVRNAQLALEKSGIIELDSETNNWKLKKCKGREVILESITDIEEPPGIPVKSEELEEFVGEPMDLGFMNRSPTTHDEVIALFVGYRNRLGFPIIGWIRPQFPEACALQRVKEPRVGYLKKYIEFEFLSSQFKEHTMNPIYKARNCHYVICWENDWDECPVPVIELKTEVLRVVRELSDRAA